MLEPIPSALAGIEEKEIDLLVSTVDRLLRIGRWISFDRHIFDRAVAYRSRFGLPMQDMIMLATVALDLEQSDLAERGYFVSKNWKDFDEPGIRGELLGRNCVLVNDFERLLAMVSSRS